MAGAEARWSANNGYIIFGTLARRSLLSEGENPKVVSERLGHASITLTLGYRGFQLLYARELCAALMQDVPEIDILL